MERLSLFRPVSNSAVSGFLSHTLSDRAETLLVGWTGGKKFLVLLMWYFAIRSATLLRLFHQWLPSGIVALQSMSGSSKYLPAGKRNFKKKENIRRESHVPSCPADSWESCSLWCSGEEDFKGKRLEQSSCRCCLELLSRSILTCELVTHFLLLLPLTFWLLLWSTL